MITAEEFFRNKIKEQNPNREVITLSQEVITAEQGTRWAHEFKQLHLHNVVGRSEQLCPHENIGAANAVKMYCMDCKKWVDNE